MHGVQPTAKTAPRVNAAPRPVRPATSPLPTRLPTLVWPSAPAGARAIPPVIVATLADAPASSGRHVRSRTPIRRIPARLRPITIRTTPPTTRSGAM